MQYNNFMGDLLSLRLEKGREALCAVYALFHMQ